MALELKKEKRRVHESAVSTSFTGVWDRAHLPNKVFHFDPQKRNSHFLLNEN